LRLPVGQCGALDRVAVIEEQRVRKFRARLPDQACGTFEADVRVLGELEIIVAENVRMQVGRLQHGDPGAHAIRGSSEGRHAAARAEKQEQDGGGAMQVRSQDGLLFGPTGTRRSLTLAFGTRITITLRGTRRVVRGLHGRAPHLLI